jgi:hypothetical protein
MHGRNGDMLQFMESRQHACVCVCVSVCSMACAVHIIMGKLAVLLPRVPYYVL